LTPKCFTFKGLAVTAPYFEMEKLGLDLSIATVNSVAVERERMLPDRFAFACSYSDEICSQFHLKENRLT
jgi:hypothetical protein